MRTHERKTMTKNPGTKNLLRTLTVSLIVAASSFAAALASPAQDLFDQATFYLEFQYYGPSKLDLKTLTSKYQAELDKACSEAKDTCGYDKAEPLIGTMLADLEDKHAYYLTAEDVAQESAQVAGTATSPSPRIGITHTGFVEVEGKRQGIGGLTPEAVQALQDGKAKLLSNDRLITSVLPNSPAEKAGLKTGDRWIGYNGILFAGMPLADYAKVLDQFGVKIRASETVTITVLRGAERKKLEIAIKGEIVNLVVFPSLDIQANGVAILKLPDFFIQGVGQRVHDLVREAQSKNVKAIILDMRGNGGGLGNERAIAGGAFFENPENMRRVPRYNADTQTVEEVFKDGAFVQRILNGPVLGKQPVSNPVLWKGPMAVLIDEGCASACEYMAAYFQRMKRGPVIGAPSLGIGNTNTQRFALINGAAAAFPTLRASWSDGVPLPEQIQPDIAAASDLFTIFETGRDSNLEKALQVLGL
jgi:carboxyl-terminal processing protease